jgi:hypothetical protein
MKYFTPDLLDRSRSRDDDVAEAAASEWEQAGTAYLARFTSIRAQLPGGARRLSRASLHDAKLLSVFSSSKRMALFGMVLQLDGSPKRPGEFLELEYHPVAGANGGVKVTAHQQASWEKNSRGKPWILYDEFDLDAEHAFFVHSLLLTDGREIEIRFHNLTVRQLDEVLTPTELPEGEKKWPLAEVVL